MRGVQDPEWVRSDDPNAVHVTESEAIIICDGSNSGEVFSGFTGALASTMAKIEPKVPIDQTYLRRFLESNAELFAGSKTGTAIPHLDQEAMFKLQIPMPPLSEQQRIVRLLDEAFEGIAIAKANAEKNLQNARALFKSQLQSVFTQSGNGWTDRALEEICSVSAGNSAPQDPGYFTEGTIPFFRTSDAGRIKFGTIYESQDKLNSHGASKLRRYPAGTILFPKSGASTFLNHRVVLGVEGCVSSHLATIVPDLDHVLPQFLLYALTLIDAKDLIQDQSYPSLNLPAIENIRIYLPPLDEQQQVVHLLDELQVITDKLARICSAKQASLEDLKESLLHQAFSGNLEAA
jgi:restriction endonuclease S subunit